MGSARPPSTSTAGRPRAFDTDEVLDAALEKFWRDGFGATTTRELAKELGINQSSIYNAFGSKKDLLATAVARYQGRITQQLLEPLEAPDAGLEALSDFFARLGQWVRDSGRRGCMIINLMAEDGGASADISATTRGYRKRVRRAFVGALRRAAEAGDTTATNVEGRADMLLSVVLGLNIAARGGASMAELARIASGTRTQIADWKT